MVDQTPSFGYLSALLISSTLYYTILKKASMKKQKWKPLTIDLSIAIKISTLLKSTLY